MNLKKFNLLFTTRIQGFDESIESMQSRRLAKTFLTFAFAG